MLEDLSNQRHCALVATLVSNFIQLATCARNWLRQVYVRGDLRVAFEDFDWNYQFLFLVQLIAFKGRLLPLRVTRVKLVFNLQVARLPVVYLALLNA